jgi:hypothetical protein
VWYTLRRPEPRKNLGLVNVFIQNGNFPLLWLRELSLVTE